MITMHGRAQLRIYRGRAYYRPGKELRFPTGIRTLSSLGNLIGLTYCRGWCILPDNYKQELGE